MESIQQKGRRGFVYNSLMVTKVSELSRQTVSYPKVEDLKITNDNYRRCRRLFPREDVTLVYKVKEGDIPLYIEPTDS